MACPCDALVFPLAIFNPPGRSAILYRAGDYLTFRRALLQSLPGEVELIRWQPTAQGDLALQMIEWWAYIGDVLTFYNERIANQDYLRTADLPESVQRLIRLLGYRPRPGIGAHGTLAALLSRPKPITLPAGFQIQSKPGPGKQPQIFELSAPTLIQAPDAISAIPVPDPSLFGADGSVLLQGTVSSIKPGDELVLMHKGWIGLDADLNPDPRFAIVVAQSATPQKDPSGNSITRVMFASPPSLPPGGLAAEYRLLRSTQSAHVWQYPADHVIQHGEVDLESVTRGIKVTDPVLFVLPDASPTEQLVSVVGYSESVFYANPTGPPFDPTKAPPPPAIPIAIPHTRIQFAPFLTGATDSVSERGTALVRYGFQDIGVLIAHPSNTLPAGADLAAVAPAVFPLMNAAPLLVEDAAGNGEAATGTASPDGKTMHLAGLPSLPPVLVPPLNVLFDLLPVTRGKSVANEVLGSGDATVAGQEFILKNSPLTYLQSASSASGSDYASTLQVWVNGVRWKEAPSFFGQSPSAHIFVTREDEQNRTHVQFGDGVNGARLLSGVNNVVAAYRYGSGAEAPDAGSLNVILQPQPGLKSIRNPVPVGGGADPDPPPKIKKYAPASVLNFGRAVSIDDYETIASQAPGVTRAKAYWTWDAIQQRAMVTVYAGDDDNAVSSTRAAIAAADDPNRAFQVLPAKALPIVLSLTLIVDPDYVAADVVRAATAALIDPDAGLLGANAIGIGQRIYESEIYQACLNVPGAVAVHNLHFSHLFTAIFTFKAPIKFFFTLPLVFLNTPFRFDPGEGGFFQLAAANLTISPEVAPNAG